ncbi:signal transduction histidine kinase [Pedobacter sp. AK017]|uniref:tetratricopeptide repeat-containing sensor histidine kinase n=1 Tax=Pedobacter sp. AK017 TaxID=2723073 RepID=UPI0016127458|nr:sensor histidine kinase [Pedobacter sp. AK017]MBB5441007.1 signal transduction histidine kinase [Pedobacter sp. AK017]
MKKLVLVFLIGLIGFANRAQTVINKDSLLRLLPKAKEDSAKVLLYLEVGNVYELNNPQMAAKYYRLAGQLSKKLNYKRGIVKYISNYTALLDQKAQFDSSLLLNKQAIELAKSLNDKLALAKCYANTGNVYQYLNDGENALQYYETAKKCFEEIGNKQLVARICDVMQNCYRKLNQIEKALQLGREAVSILRKEDDAIALGMALTNLGNNYETVQSDSAFACYNEALTIFKKQNHSRGVESNLLNIGNIYLHRYNADGMKPYYEKGLALAQQLEDPEGETIANRGMAHYFLYKKNFGEAIKSINKALFISDSLDLKYEHQKNLKSLSAILYATNDIIGAEKALDSAGFIEDQLNGDEVTLKTLAISKKFETEKKEAQIKLQAAEIRQKSILNYFLIAGAVAFLAISLLTYRNYKHRQKLQQAKIDELETEKQLTATEAVLKGEEQERTRLAKDLHDGLGGMLSGIKFSLGSIKENLIMTPDNAHAFERSIDMLDSSIKEMRRVAHNMMPEILVNYGLDTALKELCTEMDKSGVLHVSYQSVGMHQTEIPQTTSVTIYRIIQELLNNIVKHANAKNVLVQLHQSAQEKLLAVTVEDDGNGFDTEQLKQPAGMGWHNIKNRVEFLKGKIDLQSAPGKGTSIMIEINI